MNAEYLQQVVNQTRPLKGSETGLASKFFVKSGIAYSYYRAVLLATPVENLPDFCVDGDDLVRAVNAMKGTVKLTVTETRLNLSAGKLRTWLPLYKEELPILPQPTHFTQVVGSILPTLKELAKLVPEEAAKLWGTSLLLRGEYGYATDSTYIVRSKLGVKLPFEVALPKSCVSILIKLQREPASIAFERNTLTITFSDNSYVQTPVLSERWPDLSSFFPEQVYTPVSSELVETLAQIKQYAEPGVTLDITGPSTAKFFVNLTEACLDFDSPCFSKPCKFSLKHLVQFIREGSQIAYNERFATVINNEQYVTVSYRS